MKTKFLGMTVAVVVLLSGVAVSRGQEHSSSGLPCSEGQALREMDGELMGPEDWEFLLAYDCPLLQRLATGDLPDSAFQTLEWEDDQVCEDAAAIDSWTGSAETRHPAADEGTEMTEEMPGEGTKVDGASWVEWRSEPDPPVEGIFPEEATEADVSLAELQESFVAAGCAASPMPRQCMTHPYFVYSQDDDGGVAWDTMN